VTIAAIMPCKGRLDQTVANVKRLLGTAGYQDWRLYAIAGRADRDVLTALAKIGIPTMTPEAETLTYWQALADATAVLKEPLLINLANDVLPGQHWLRRAVEAYQETFGTGDGMLGFNGDSHELEHSCHFLLSRQLLMRYGGWPVWYKHNFGDTELCQRAIADDLYAKAPWAILYHDHPYWGGQDDRVYEIGRETIPRDQMLYEQRKRTGWPNVNGTMDIGAVTERLVTAIAGATTAVASTANTLREQQNASGWELHRQ
jgi:hypothetical protein